MSLNTTLDGLLGRRVILEQPADGFRVAIDTVLLAAAHPAKRGDKILDLGCGAGGAMLCLTCRVPGLQGLGIEIQPPLLELALKNILRNSFATGLRAEIGDARNLGIDEKFDSVICNPPFHDKERHDVSEIEEIKKAKNDEPGDFDLWLESAHRALKPGGQFTLIYRADRLKSLEPKIKELFPAYHTKLIYTKAEAPAKRLLLRGSKSRETPLETVSKPLILHRKDGRYTDEAENILRNMGRVDF